MGRLRSRHDREIFRLALPALGTLAAELLYVLVDTAIVGHLGRPQRAGLGLAGTGRERGPAGSRGLHRRGAEPGWVRPSGPSSTPA